MKNLHYNDIIYARSLQRVHGLGNRSVRHLTRLTKGLEALFAMSKKELLELDGLSKKVADLVMAAKKEMEFAAAEFEACQKLGAEMLVFTDEQYPQRLRVFDDAPVVVFWRGNKQALHQDKTIGVVGTRAATEFGKRHTAFLIESWREYQPTIISGLAYGIDVAAHQTAVQMEVPTIGVLGNGIDMVYPSLHRKVAQEMLEHGGLLSEFPPGTKPDRQNFPMRNRIVAMLSDALVVVEAAERGGALITANLAFDYNKEVYAVPGKPSDRFSAGCNQIIADNKAVLLQNPKQLINDMLWDTSKQKAPQQGKLYFDLDPLSQEIIAVLSENPKISLEELSFKLNKKNYELLTPLLDLELKSIIISLPGNLYELK